MTRVRGFVRSSAALYLVFLAAGLYLSYPTFGPAFWALVLILVLFAAVDVHVLRRLGSMGDLLAAGRLRPAEARVAVAGLSRQLLAGAAVLGATCVALLLAVALTA